ncbi:STAS domain-containing protein [Kitasatospora sp. CM 4170]|uniref:STAS domain-containing protein n=1 Tax=Kitasatospora aburaviensis TaxID=67265 RepID=A0ABW1EWH7_9ACTN|nr:STAS domain-containing protein [Kitasatospora sp. CM 4170]WNM43934.1 STAS domain-containing protein [Kitasatospora sp. CM 4170]
MTYHGRPVQSFTPHAVFARDLKITVSIVGDAMVCAFTGDLHMDNEDQVRRTLSRAIATHPALLAVDLSGVELFTSSGLNALLCARRAALAHDVTLVLAAPSRTVLRVFGITEAGLVFAIRPTLHRALHGARGGPVTGSAEDVRVEIQPLILRP